MERDIVATTHFQPFAFCLHRGMLEEPPVLLIPNASFSEHHASITEVQLVSRVALNRFKVLETSPSINLFCFIGRSPI